MMVWLADIWFYKWQLLQALLLGGMLSAAGHILVIRSEIVFGLLLAQAILLARMILMLLGLSDGWVGYLLSAGLAYTFVAPFYFRARLRRNAELVLLAGFFCFTALGEIVAAVGHLRPHLLQIYSGNILTIVAQDIWITLIIIIIFWMVWQVWKLPLLMVSMDREHARAMGMSVRRWDHVYLAMLVLLFSWCILQTGLIYSLSMAIVPALLIMPLARSLLASMIAAMGLVMLAHLLGFGLSVVEWNYAGASIRLPSSSLVIIFLFVLGAFWHALRKIQSGIVQRSADK